MSSQDNNISGDSYNSSPTSTDGSNATTSIDQSKDNVCKSDQNHDSQLENNKENVDSGDLGTLYNIIPMEELGIGCCSVVHKGRRRSGEIVAVKIINKTVYRQKVTSSFPILREYEIHSSLNHSNIAKIFEVIDLKENVVFVLEFVNGLNLLDYWEMAGIIPMNKILSLFKQLAQAISYLHSRNVIHRDIKLENCMLTQDNNVLKLIDFGLATIADDNALLQDYCGTAEYASMELWLRTPYRGKPVDIWSAGVCLYIMCCNKLPFNTVKQVTTGILIMEQEDIADKSVDRLVRSSVISLLRTMLTHVSNRFTIDTILSHELLVNIELTSNSPGV